MAQRLLMVPQIGEVILSKRKGNNKIRLSINQAGQVRVGMPYWTPYEAGLIFVRKNQSWIQDQLAKYAPSTLLPNQKIGKYHKIVLKRVSAKNDTEVRVTSTDVRVNTLLDQSLPIVQEKIRDGCQRALKQEANRLLPARVNAISRKFDLSYKSLKVRKLTSRWGSCSSKRDISLSYFLIQLPWELIDYVILHELAHTVHHNHSRRFWDFMSERQANLNDLRKQIKLYKPRVEPLEGLKSSSQTDKLDTSDLLLRVGF